MAKPIAYFSYFKNGKVLNLKDLSLNAPISYLWDFGNGETSTDKNPEITFDNNGFYQVSLISTNDEGDSDALILQIGIGETNETLDIPLLQLIDQYIPDSIVGYSTSSEKINLIRKWQSYLQPLLVTPFKVSTENTFNEFAWPILANTMIAMLVSYDLIKILAQRALTSIMTGITSSTDEEQNNNSSQNVKKITTGPTEVEFQSSSDQSKTVTGIMSGDDSPSTELLSAICNLSQRLLIYLPGMCEKLPNIVISPQVSKLCSTLHWEKWLPLGDYYYPIFVKSSTENLQIVQKIVYESTLVQYTPISFENTSDLEVILVTVEDLTSGETYNSNFTKNGEEISIEPYINITQAEITLLLG